jgi:hypothetical protein
MDPTPNRQEDRAASLLRESGMVRLSEFIEQGISATTISRMAVDSINFPMPLLMQTTHSQKPQSSCRMA